MPVDPAFQPVLEAMSTMPAPAPDADPVAAARAGTDAMFVHPAPPDVAVADRTVPGPGGDVALRVYTPHDLSGPAGVLVYFHGGGFVAGSITSHDGTARELAVGARCVVVSVGYRLAPEHPYPAAFDDCVAALDWVAANAATIGADPARLAIGGDSAGGNLCAAVARHNRDAGGPALALQLLVYPVIDPACTTESMKANGAGYMLTADSMRWMWQTYAGADSPIDAALAADPSFAPVAAADLRDLPPALVITAEFDPLRDEGEQYAERLRDAGVDVTATRYDGQIHGFFSMHALAPQARVATDQATQALQRAFGDAG